MVELAKIQNGSGVDKEWTPELFHRVHPSQVGENKLWWRLDDSGIFVLGENSVRRTRGKPVTLTRIKEDYDRFIENTYCVLANAEPLWFGWHDFNTMVAAMIATESGGKPKAFRSEGKEFSCGLTQTLTATAYSIAKRLAPKLGILNPPGLPVTRGGSATAWKAYLSDPETSIALGAAYIWDCNKRYKCKFDPILLYAAYNAGSPRPSNRRPWGLVYYDVDYIGPKPGAMDHFAAWYGDACAVYHGT